MTLEYAQSFAQKKLQRLKKSGEETKLEEKIYVSWKMSMLLKRKYKEKMRKIEQIAENHFEQ
jgi:hypothetical protein